MTSVNVAQAVAETLPPHLQAQWLALCPAVQGGEFYQIGLISATLRHLICNTVADPNVADQLRDNVTMISSVQSLTLWLNHFKQLILPSFVNGEIRLHLA